jgi:hypothetical protein
MDKKKLSRITPGSSIRRKTEKLRGLMPETGGDEEGCCVPCSDSCPDEQSSTARPGFSSKLAAAAAAAGQFVRSSSGPHPGGLAEEIEREEAPRQ